MGETMINASDFQKWLEIFNVVQGAAPTPPFSFPLIGEYGGTGVANIGKTITIGGNLRTVGAFTSDFTMTGNTAVTFPTSGTLATTATASGIVNSGLINQLSYYAAAGTTLSGLAIVNSAGLTTTAGGVPTWVAATGTGAPVFATSPTLVTPALGAATGTSLALSGALSADSASFTAALPVLSGGTGVTTSTGSGANVLSTSPTLVTPDIGVATGTSLALSGALSAASATLTAALTGENGGTGVANTGKTITIGGNLSTIGAFTSDFTMTGNTAVTFPTSGTLATTASASGIVNSGLINQLAYYAAAGTTLSGLATGNNGLLVTSAAGVPSIGNAILSAITIQGMSVGLGAGSVLTNAAVGYEALFSNTTGNSNTANGFRTLFSNTTGTNNTANGFRTLFSNTTGINNAANGYEALFSNTTGNNNTANGFRTLFLNTVGINNAANGYEALFSNTTGNNNAAVGLRALYSNTTGSNNAAVGADAGRTIASGSVALTTGSFNTLLGYAASVNSATSAGTLALGAHAVSDIATGVLSTDNGAGIAIGSALYKVGFRGDGTIYPTSGASLGFQRIKINGTYYKIELFDN